MSNSDKLVVTYYLSDMLIKQLLECDNDTVTKKQNLEIDLIELDGNSQQLVKQSQTKNVRINFVRFIISTCSQLYF